MKKITKSELLTDKQALTVKTMIIDSIRSVWIDQSCGLVPEDVFIATSNTIADRIIQNVQMSLAQSANYNKLKPLIAAGKKVKKPIKKIKKHARK